MTGENSESKGSYSEAVGTRLTVQTNRQFEEYKQENELGDAEALRRLVRQGLEEQERSTFVDSIVMGAILAAFALLAFGIIELEVWLLAYAGALFLLGFVANRYSAEIRSWVG